jgi:hypothetical protein
VLHLDTWKLRHCGGLPVSTKEPRVAEIFAQDRKTTGKAGDDPQYESYHSDECEWVRPDGGSGSDTQVVDLCVHATHGDGWQRQHLSGITPVNPRNLRPFRGRSHRHIWVSAWFHILDHLPVLEA